LFPRYSEPYKEQNTVQNNSGGYPQGQNRYPETLFSLANYPSKEDVANWVAGNLAQEALTALPAYFAFGKTPENLGLNLASAGLAGLARRFPILTPVAAGVISYANTPTPVKRVLNNAIFNAVSDPILDKGKEKLLNFGKARQNYQQ